MTVEDVKRFKITDENIIEALRDKLKEYFVADNWEPIRSMRCVIDGTYYTLKEIYKTEWSVTDEQEVQNIKYQLVSFDGIFEIDKFDIILSQHVQREELISGYCYKYQEPIIQKIFIIKVPKRIILEHEEIEVEEI